MIILLVLGAILLFLDGAATIFSSAYFERRQKIFGMHVKAPPGIDAKKYYLTNRIIAGLIAIGTGCVCLYMISEFKG